MPNLCRLRSIFPNVSENVVTVLLELREDKKQVSSGFFGLAPSDINLFMLCNK